MPCWLGQKTDQIGYKIVSNSNCVVRLTKEKPPYPGNPDFAAMERELAPLWDWLRAGNRKPGIYHDERSVGRVMITVQ